MNNDIKDYKLEDNNPMLNQANFIYLSTGIDNVFDKLNHKNKKTIDTFRMFRAATRQSREAFLFYT